MIGKAISCRFVTMVFAPSFTRHDRMQHDNPRDLFGA
jgi:hypothetical protein